MKKIGLNAAMRTLSKVQGLSRVLNNLEIFGNDIFRNLPLLGAEKLLGDKIIIYIEGPRNC